MFRGGVYHIMKKFVYYAIFLLAALIVGFHECESQEVKPVRYTIVTVERGDTVWSIAAKHSTQSQDIRNVIAVMKQANNLKRFLFQQHKKKS